MADVNGRQLLRVMVDTTVLVAGIGWPRWPNAVLRHAQTRDFHLVLSPYGIAEARRKFQQRFPQFAPDFEQFLIDCIYEEVANPSAHSLEQHQHLMRDIADLPIALAAIEAKVDYFVSEDKDFTAPTPENAALHARLAVRLSGTFLREVMGWSSEALEALRGRTWADIDRN